MGLPEPCGAKKGFYAKTLNQRGGKGNAPAVCSFVRVPKISHESRQEKAAKDSLDLSSEKEINHH